MKIYYLLAVFALAASFADGQAGPNADVPVAPIAATSMEGWTNVFKLQNPALEIVVAPCAGRIVRISYKGDDNILRLDAGLKDRVPDGGGDELWMNYGGDWIWPVAQSRWTSIAKSDWVSAASARR